MMKTGRAAQPSEKSTARKDQFEKKHNEVLLIMSGSPDLASAK